ncbi:leucine-rich repeat domain-containing protein [Flammeovirga pacifica]|uniref:Leucine-rich repeat domain-containing protein n=1 Tax=Flammeovirga pacifica TaxID=915059 RepID=A0A1S1YZ99_FLAPC|nr:leucine-rich repeat domain-containing protein [Flammeovirga pacifica]OHX66322.1 hypothetical protein NH26_08130 [Flammeovirga pacifica]
MKASIKTIVINLLLPIILFSFTNPVNDDPTKYLNKGKDYFYQKEYIKAIGELTIAISMQKNLGEAYYYRGLSKDLLGKKEGYYNEEFCYDLIKAMHYGYYEAVEQLYKRGQFEAIQLSYLVEHPEKILCIDLADHQLSEFPESFSEMENLISVNINDNNIRVISSDFFDNHPNIIQLNLSQNYLKELPKSLTHQKYLYELNLSYNRLKSLPHQMNEMKQLRVLNLRGNQLHHLDHNVKDLDQLKVLNLSINQFKKIPKVIYLLANLEELDLSGNIIDEKEIKKLKMALPDTHIIY